MDSGMKKQFPFHVAGGKVLSSGSGELSLFIKSRIYILLLWISLIWLIALLFAITDLLPVITALRKVKWRKEHPNIHCCAPGPWGDIRYSQIVLEPPDNFLTVMALKSEKTKWVFVNRTSESLVEFIENAHLTEQQKNLFFRRSRHVHTANGITVYPDKELVLGLSRQSRNIIYNELGRYEANFSYMNPFVLDPQEVDSWLAESGLSPDIQAMLRKLFFNCGSKIGFIDLYLILPEMGTLEERIHFCRLLCRTVSLLPKLYITENSDIDQIARYWTKNGNAKDIRPILHSLAQIPGGGALDIAHLLPPLMRKLIYTHPNPAEINLKTVPDCHWTALNFFSLNPLNIYSPNNTNRLDINENYYLVEGKPVFGDIIMLVKPDSTLLHSCNYIADNLVLTKNGLSLTQPWIISKLEDVLNNYSYCEYKILILRRKGT